MRGPQMRHPKFLLLISALLIASQALAEGTQFCPADGWENELVIHEFAVGQGASTFIRTPKGTTILIDGGLPNKGDEVVIPTLQKCYVKVLQQIDYVVVT